MNPKTNFWRLCIVAGFVFTLTPAAGKACTCAINPNTCNTDWKRGQVIFLGRVTAKDPIPDPRTNAEYRFPGRLAVHFAISESFRGLSSNKETVVFTGVGGGDCGYPFVIGETYLVYAFTYQDQLTTSICTQTRPAVMAAALTRQLRASRNGSERSPLFGMIGTAPRGAGYEDLIESKALAGVRVRAISSSGLDYSTTSDDQGVYSFEGLPADTYRLEIDMPEGLSAWRQNEGKPLTVQLGNTDDSRGCPVDVFGRPDGRVSGVVVDMAGRNLAGFITIKPADPNEAEAAARRGGLPGFTTDDGKFTLWQLPPGRYQLIFYPKEGGQIRFAGGGFRSETIEIRFGQHIENFQFKVPIPTRSQ